eukprot:scaffold97624_cov49-Prasinocladus_malaysianus.AAC.2
MELEVPLDPAVVGLGGSPASLVSLTMLKRDCFFFGAAGSPSVLEVEDCLWICVPTEQVKRPIYLVCMSSHCTYCLD